MQLTFKIPINEYSNLLDWCKDNLTPNWDFHDNSRIYSVVLTVTTTRHLVYEYTYTTTFADEADFALFMFTYPDLLV